MHRYGAKPHKQDALDFWVAHVRALLPHIHEQQRACRADPQRILPTAFVTFKTRRAQVGALHVKVHACLCARLLSTCLSVRQTDDGQPDCSSALR